MAKALRVIAVAPGFYGTYRDPDDEFSIRSIGDFSAKWMKPKGWKLPHDGKYPSAQDKDAPKSDDDVALDTFRGFKETYGEGAAQINGADAVREAFAQSGMPKEAWNEMGQAERKKLILDKVKEMVNAKQAQVAGEADPTFGAADD